MAQPQANTSLTNKTSQGKFENANRPTINVTAPVVGNSYSGSGGSVANPTSSQGSFGANKPSQEKVTKGGKDAATNKSDPSFMKILAASGKVREDDKYVTDPDFHKDFVEAIDKHVKLMLLTMMFLATLIWGIFFYSWFHLPPQIFAHGEIKRIFLPLNYWSGIYWQIACPWLAGLYCLIVVVYPDPRRWRFCLAPRRPWRWVPYMIPLIYTVVVNTYWLYCLFLVPANLKRRMVGSVKKSLNTKTRSFPIIWEYVHNYYQCCGIDSKLDWSHKIIPQREIPYPYKNDTVCREFYYGYYHEKYSNCSNGNYSALGVLWPASCCNNMSSFGCQTLPSNSHVWKGYCLIYEMVLSIGTIVLAMLISMIIDILGIFVFFKTCILEAAALREKLKPPKPHI